MLLSAETLAFALFDTFRVASSLIIPLSFRATGAVFDTGAAVMILIKSPLAPFFEPTSIVLPELDITNQSFEPSVPGLQHHH